MAGKATILCVDDEATILHTTKLILGKAGYEVIGAANVSDALRSLNNHQIDVILLDCVPDRGWLVDAAKEANQDVHILLCTGGLADADIPGIERVVQKPIPPPELLQLISETLGRTSVVVDMTT
jgi:CheY-like chemotaxis protein